MKTMQCDVCGRPIKESVTIKQPRESVMFGTVKVRFEIRAGLGKAAAVTLGTGDLCMTCLKLALVRTLGKFPSRKAQPGSVPAETTETSSAASAATTKFEADAEEKAAAEVPAEE